MICAAQPVLDCPAEVLSRNLRPVRSDDQLRVVCAAARQYLGELIAGFAREVPLDEGVDVGTAEFRQPPVAEYVLLAAVEPHDGGVEGAAPEVADKNRLVPGG